MGLCEHGFDIFVVSMAEKAWVSNFSIVLWCGVLDWWVAFVQTPNPSGQVWLTPA